MMTFSLSDFGSLIYLMPAAFIILLSREAVRNFLLEGQERQPRSALYFTDPLALVNLSLFGYSWGGMIHSERRDDLRTYLISQFWFIFLMLLVWIYCALKLPGRNDYAYLFSAGMMKFSWNLFLINWLPLPPLDASFAYLQPALKTGRFSLISKLIATGLIFLAFRYNYLPDSGYIVRLLPHANG